MLVKLSVRVAGKSYMVHWGCRHADMMAVYNQHLLQSGTPVLKFKKPRWQHTPMADTPRSNASSTYDLEDSFLAQGTLNLGLGPAKLPCSTAVYAHPPFVCVAHLKFPAINSAVLSMYMILIAMSSIMLQSELQKRRSLTCNQRMM